MFNIKSTSSKLKWQRGQSLVETALFLPIFLVILAGVVEVSQYVITNNRLTSAARASTRFASNGGEDAGMVSILKNSVTNTMSLDEDMWDVFSIRGTLNDAGDGFSDWDFLHIYGISNTQYLTPVFQLDEMVIQQEILADLKFDQNGDPINTPEALAAELGGLRIVGTYIIHDMQSILNLDATPAISSIYSVREMSVMRISGLNIQPTAGCSGFPIALQEGVRSVSPPGQGAVPFPDAADFAYPAIPPDYNQFVRHIRDAFLDDSAQEGTVFLFALDSGTSKFDWLVWNDQIIPDDTVLANSMSWPGDTLDYTNHGDAGNAHPAYGYVVRGYAEPGNVFDQELHKENIIRATLAQLGSNVGFDVVNLSVEENIARGRDLRVILFEPAGDFGTEYEVKRFGVFKLHGYGNPSLANEWILAEFIRWDDTCGQTVDIP